MKKKIITPKVTHIFRGGKLIPDEEFHSKPYAVNTELNREFLLSFNRTFDPRWHEKERLPNKADD